MCSCYSILDRKPLRSLPAQFNEYSVFLTVFNFLNLSSKINPLSTMKLFPMRPILTLLATLLLSACSISTLSTESAAPVVAKPKNITLLVPLEGANGSSGQAIRNGFLAAYYYAKQNMADAPAINVVDTNTGSSNIVALYQQAATKGADFIVGPLTKQDVQTLAGHDHLTIPVLALNTLDMPKTVTHLYQFGLSPQEEAAQVASRAKQDGFSRALIIAPAGSWGNDIAKAFEEKWQKAGGTITYRLAYPSKGDMTLMVQKALKNGTANPDVVFLVATPSYARQIKPLLTFYGTHSLAVYATSLVYTGVPSGQDHDLDGIIFADMPWTLGTDTPALNQIRSTIQTLWGDSYNRSPRLYALGIDAYHLTYAFNQLSSGVDGATGKLTLDTNQRVRRTLEWAKFKDGVPQRMP